MSSPLHSAQNKIRQYFNWNGALDNSLYSIREHINEALRDLTLADKLLVQARKDWLEANDPKDGTDCVTPYDEWFYKDRK